MNERHLEIMTAQEMTDIMSRTPSTTSAVGPLLCSISTSALEDCPAGGGPSEGSVGTCVAASCRKRAKANRVIGVRVKCTGCEGGGVRTQVDARGWGLVWTYGGCFAPLVG